MSPLVENLIIVGAIMLIINIFFTAPLVLQFWSDDAFAKYKNKKKIYLWVVGITNIIALFLSIYLVFFF